VKRHVIVFSLLCLAFNLFAEETVYVSDELSIDVRNGESTRHRIIKMLPSGTPLVALEQNSETGYTKVRLRDGVEGYILTRYLQKQPVSRWYLDQANKRIQALESENNALKAQMKTLKGDASEVVSSNQTLQQERDQLAHELNELRITAANAIQLKQQRDELQERVVTVEREFEQIKREKQALEDNRNQDWFLYGGILAFGGIFLGLILPRLRWQRRHSGWDTF